MSTAVEAEPEDGLAEPPTAEESLEVSGDVQKASTFSGIYTIRNVNSGKVINVDGSSHDTGANILQRDNPQATSSQWEISNAQTAGAYVLRNINSGKFISVASESEKNGANVLQDDNPEAAGAQWVIANAQTAGAFVLRNVKSDKHINVISNSVTNGANIIQWNSPDATGSQWYLTKVEPEDGAEESLEVSGDVQKEKLDEAPSLINLIARMGEKDVADLASMLGGLTASSLAKLAEALEDCPTATTTRLPIEDTIDEALLFELREAFLLGMHPGDRNFIDSRKLLTVLRSLGIAASPSEHAELIAAADPTGSGQISWQVFLAMGSILAAARKDPKIEEAALLEAFRKVDNAGAGTVKVCELRRAAKQVEQEEADRSALWKVIRDQEVHGEMNYEEFVRRHVSERKWHKSYCGPGGFVAANT